MLKFAINFVLLLTITACGFSRERLLPPSYTECSDNFSWTLGYFQPRAKLERLNNSRLFGKIGIDARSIPGQFYRRHSFDGNDYLNHSEAQICQHIHLKIAGEYDKILEKEFVQYFDYDHIHDLVSSNKNYHEIDNNMVILKSLVLKPMTDKIDAVLSTSLFEGSARCEKKWTVKADPNNANYVIFKIPEGKCHFSITNHEIELPTGQKVNIAAAGYYEKDPDSPQNRVLVNIERIGFRNK